jgi:D-alanyl-D-alanine carboxypeptidase
VHFPGRKQIGIGVAVAVALGLIASIGLGRDPSISPQDLSAMNNAGDATSDSVVGERDRNGKPLAPRVTIERRVAPTVEVTFGSAAEWEGRPRTAMIASPTPWTPQRLAFMGNLAKLYKSKSSVAYQGTVELFDDALNPAWAYPVWAIALDPAAAAELVGPDIANALQRNEFVLSTTAAAQRGASTETKLTLAGWDDPILIKQSAVGAIVADERTLGAELLMSIETAKSLALNRPWRVMVWEGEPGSVARDAASTVGTKYVSRSWTAPSVDEVLTIAALKQLLGEFAILRRNGLDPSVAGTDVDSDPSWVQKNIVRANLPIIGPTNVHRKLVKPLKESLAEIEQAGLAPLIDVYDTRRYGGSFNSRLIKSQSGTSGRNLSRHSWGAAIDINPSTNRYGTTPTMDERVVDVFRRHGFAWGGTFPIADGMHFEFIGKPRITGPKLPPGTISTTSTSTTSTSTTSTSTTSTLPPSTNTSTSIASTTSSTSTVIVNLDLTSIPSTIATSTTTTPASTKPKRTSTTVGARVENSLPPTTIPSTIAPTSSIPVVTSLPSPTPVPVEPSLPPAPDPTLAVG